MPISYIATIYSPDYIITVTVGIHLEKWCRSMPISYVATIYPPDYIITIMVEFLLKNGA